MTPHLLGCANDSDAIGLGIDWLGGYARNYLSPARLWDHPAGTQERRRIQRNFKGRAIERWVRVEHDPTQDGHESPLQSISCAGHIG